MTNWPKEYKKAFPEGIVKEILKGIKLAEKETRKKLTTGDMGMFDRIIVDESLLPIIDNVEILQLRNEELQTKCLSNTLELYEINSCGIFKDGVRQEKIYTVNFYCFTDSEVWYEFEAYFKEEDYTLKEIILIKKET